MHTIYYDASCPFCQRWKGRIAKWDKKRIFQFKAQGSACSSMELVEKSGKKWLRAKAVLRIFWLLGYYLPGCFYILPSWLIDPIYRFIARHRHKF